MSEEEQIDPRTQEPELELTVTTSDYSEFETAIINRTLYHLGGCGITDPNYILSFGQQLALRIDSMLQKYRAGQIEHGGDIRDRDLTHEETKEILDLFVYNLVRTTLQGLKAEIKI